MDHRETPIEQKKLATRDRILDMTAALVIESGSRSVSMDQIANLSAVSRRTLFNYFPSKEELLYAAAAPVMESARSYAADLLDRPTASLRDLADLTCALWDRFGTRLGLVYAIQLDDISSLRELHACFLGVLRQYIDRVTDSEPRYRGQSRFIGLLYFRVFYPLVQALDGQDRKAERFAAALRGMIDGALLV